MNKRIIIAAMAAIALAACEKKDVEPQVKPGETVTFEVSAQTSQTKITGAETGENTVNSYQFLVFNKDNGMLETYASSETASTKLTCTTGSKDIVVIANAPNLSSVVSMEMLKNTKSALKDNKKGKFVMEGIASPTLTASSNTVNVTLTRLVSKIRLKKISLNFDHASYDELNFKVLKVYLINVPADRGYLASPADPELWYNELEYDAADPNEMLYDDVNIDISATKLYDIQHHFYCYPNPYTTDSFTDEWSPRPTRLVVEAELGGVHYYYPVALPELKSNTVYEVSLEIVRPGSVTPEENMDKYESSVTVTINEWAPTVPVPETI